MSAEKVAHETTSPASTDHEPGVFEAADAVYTTSGLQRKLKARHVQMIAIGSSIGQSHSMMETRTCTTDKRIRDWSLHRLWQVAPHWRPVGSGHGFCAHRHCPIVHGLLSWGDVRGDPRLRSLHPICNSIPGPLTWLCRRMAVLVSPPPPKTGAVLTNFAGWHGCRSLAPRHPPFAS